MLADDIVDGDNAVVALDILVVDVDPDVDFDLDVDPDNFVVGVVVPVNLLQ